MLVRILMVMSVAVGFAGCAAPPMPPPPALNHPANPRAAEVPVPPPTDTLAVDANPVQPTPPPPDESAGPQRNADNPAQAKPGTDHGDGSMGGMKGMSGMGGMTDMDHGGSMQGMPGMDHPATQPTTAASRPTAMYTCPMHPQVTSGKPGKCPICGMTLVEKDAANGGER